MRIRYSLAIALAALLVAAGGAVRAVRARNGEAARHLGDPRLPREQQRHIRRQGREGRVGPDGRRRRRAEGGLDRRHRARVTWPS